MNTKKCDICREELELYPIDLHIFSRIFVDAELCAKCAEPVMDFVKKNKLKVDQMFSPINDEYDNE